MIEISFMLSIRLSRLLSISLPHSSSLFLILSHSFLLPVSHFTMFVCACFVFDHEIRGLGVHKIHTTHPVLGTTQHGLRKRKRKERESLGCTPRITTHTTLHTLSLFSFQSPTQTYVKAEQHTDKLRIESERWRNKEREREGERGEQRESVRVRQGQTEVREHKSE